MEENRRVMIRMPSGNVKIVQLVKGSTISLGKFGSFLADDLVGDPFGLKYEIDQDSSLKVVENDQFDTDGLESNAEQSMTGDRIQLLGVQSNTHQEIETLKRQKVSGDELVQAVAQGNSGFVHKTEYSKEKYLKRKKEKFLRRFTPHDITSTELIEYYTDKDPQRISNLSEETLSLLLSLANIRPGGKYLVMDSTPGVLVAAIMELMNGEGLIVLAHESEHGNLDSFKFLDLEESKRELMIKSISLLDLLHPDEAPEFVSKTGEEIAAMKSTQRGQYFRMKQRAQSRKDIAQMAADREFDGLILMSGLHMASLIPRLLPFLSGSSPVVIYSEYKEVLVETTLRLKSEVCVVAPTIMETRMRKYQTLPGRLHPHMNSRGCGGYLLYATAVKPNADAQALGKNHGKRKRPRESQDQSEESSRND